MRFVGEQPPNASADAVTESASRRSLVRLFRGASALLGLMVAYVALDYIIDFRPDSIHSSYRFTLPELVPDQPVFMQQDNLYLVVIRRSPSLIRKLQTAPDLPDAASDDSSQPEYARNRLRSREAEYFASYALGTDLGCQLVAEGEILREICGDARYDFAGRALGADADFRNLAIPRYEFGSAYRSIIVRP